MQILVSLFECQSADPLSAKVGFGAAATRTASYGRGPARAASPPALCCSAGAPAPAMSASAGPLSGRSLQMLADNEGPWIDPGSGSDIVSFRLVPG